MEHFRRWGIAEDIRSAAPVPVSWSDRILFCDSLAGCEIASFPGALGLSTERAGTHAESGQYIPQPVVEDVLRQHLSRQASVKFALGWSVTDVQEQPGHVAVTITGHNGRTRQVVADYLLGCDGPNSVVRKSMGIRMAGRSDSRPNFNVVFHAPDLRTDLPTAVQYWVVDGPTPGSIGRLDLNGMWWAVIPGVDAEYGNANTAQLIANLTGQTVDHTVVATDPWTARMLVAERFQTERVFLVGEAAHMNPPWGGHGYNTCIGDGVNIGWKIAAVHQGWAESALLESYEPERRPVVEWTVAASETNMATLAGDLPNRASEILRLKRPEFYSLGLVIGYRYTDPVVEGDPATYTPSVSPGSRLPHMWLDDGSSLYDHLGRGFTLLGPRASIATVRPPHTVLDTPRGYPWPDMYFLVRPDQHIAWSGASADAAYRELARG